MLFRLVLYFVLSPRIKSFTFEDFQLPNYRMDRIDNKEVFP